MRFSAALPPIGPLGRTPDDGNVVQQRPTLGAMQRRQSPAARWLLPALDFAAASVALAIVALAAGAPLIPAFPLAPILPVAAYAALRAYVVPLDSDENERMGYVATRLLVAALFAWTTSLLTSLEGPVELATFATYLAMDRVAQAAAEPLLRRTRHIERWLLIGDEETAEILRRYEPLENYAELVGTVPVIANGSKDRSRTAALDAVEHYGAERVLIANRHVDDEGLLEMIRAFKSVGVQVSLLPRPLDLLEAPAAMPIRVGGVPQIDIRALHTREAIPYLGPDRRRDRAAYVSVVVPTKNEARNIAHVLGQLPEDIHEVILVDANSTDDTVAVAMRARPDIRVLTQSGRGKGDALRTGFAAVTGNVIVMLDADGSADPAEIPRFVEALEGGADFAKGSRFLPGGGSDDITVLRRLGNAVLSGLANVLHGTHFTDLCYGYNAFWSRCLPFVSLDVPGFEVETLINLRVADAGMKITEVPSHEANRIHGQSNLNTFRDGFRVLFTIFREARRRHEVRPARHPVAERAAPESEAAPT